MATVNVTLPVHTAPLAAPQLLGTFFNWGLYGILSVQVYLFHIAFPKDNWIPKTIVYVIYILETLQTILVTHDGYKYYAEGFGNIDALNQTQLEWIAVPTISGIVSCTVQMYYAYRVWLLSGSKWLGMGISAIALMQGSAAIAEGAKFFIIGVFSELTKKTFVSCSIWLAGSASCDIIIAASMTYLLVRNDTKMPHTHAIVTRLVHLVVETGMLTAMAATIDLVLFLVFPDTSYHATVALTLAKLYSNSMLVILNSRIKIVGGRNSSSRSDNTFIELGTNGRHPVRFAPRTAGDLSTFGSVGVHVQEETWIERDAGEQGSPADSVKKMPALAGAV